MKASEFVQRYRGRGFSAWEKAVFELAQRGELPPNPLVAIELEGGGRRGQIDVTSDVFTIGEPGDTLRLPLTPGVAQAIANLWGMLLVTPRIAQRIAAQAPVKLVPSPQQNLGANLDDYVKHHRTIEAQLASVSAPPGSFVTGHKKDVIVSAIYQPGKVLIYGWFFPPGVSPPTNPSTGKPLYSNPIQGRSNVHDANYVDYSHGIRFMAPWMRVEGEWVRTEDVLKSPELSALLSDEGPLKVVRYPAPNPPADVPKPEDSPAPVPELVVRQMLDMGPANLGLAQMAALKRRGGG